MYVSPPLYVVGYCIKILWLLQRVDEIRHVQQRILAT